MTNPQKAREAVDVLRELCAILDVHYYSDGHSAFITTTPDIVGTLLSEARDALDAHDTFLAREREAVPAEASCDACHGTGEYFTHAEDCESDTCALNGDIDSCLGQVVRCECETLAPGGRDEPFGYAYQHDETGRIVCVDDKQEEWGFADKNPRYTRIGRLYLRPPAAAPEGLPDVETVSALVHEAWMQAKKKAGTVSRTSELGEELMVPYAQLSERAKDLDRSTVRAVYAAIVAAPAQAAKGDGE